MPIARAERFTPLAPIMKLDPIVALNGCTCRPQLTALPEVAQGAWTLVGTERF